MINQSNFSVSPTNACRIKIDVFLSPNNLFQYGISLPILRSGVLKIRETMLISLGMMRENCSDRSLIWQTFPPFLFSHNFTFTKWYKFRLFERLRCSKMSWTKRLVFTWCRKLHFYIQIASILWIQSTS